MTKETDKPKLNSAAIVPFPKKKTDDGKALARRWGNKVADHGYTMVPHLFFALQGELGLTCQQAMAILHLLDHWWHTSEGMPWPSKRTLATRMNMSERNVQRVLTELESEKLIKRRPRYFESGGQKSNEFDLSGLIDQLKKLEPNYRTVREAKKARRDQAERPARRRRAGAQPPAK